MPLKKKGARSSACNGLKGAAKSTITQDMRDTYKNAAPLVTRGAKAMVIERPENLGNARWRARIAWSNIDTHFHYLPLKQKKGSTEATEDYGSFGTLMAYQDYDEHASGILVAGTRAFRKRTQSETSLPQGSRVLLHRSGEGEATFEYTMESFLSDVVETFLPYHNFCLFVSHAQAPHPPPSPQLF